MLTVHSLLEETGLSLIAGERSAEAPIRWVHISELLDPTPWLSGGELLLTTGIQLRTEDEEREVMRALSAAIGGAVIMIDGRGEPSAAAEFRRPIPERALAAISEEVDAQGSAGIATSFEPSHEQVAGRGLVLPIPPDVRGGPRSWLVAVRDQGTLGEFERLILQQGVTVVA